jgi:hypothetical protein
VNDRTAQLADNKGDGKCGDFVTGVMQPSTAFCVWDFHTVSAVVYIKKCLFYGANTMG